MNFKRDLRVHLLPWPFGHKRDPRFVNHLDVDLAYAHLRITAELNVRYHSPDESRSLMSELTGREIPPVLPDLPSIQR